MTVFSLKMQPEGENKLLLTVLLFTYYFIIFMSSGV